MSLPSQRASLRPLHTPVANGGRVLFNIYIISTSTPLPNYDFKAVIRLEPGQFEAKRRKPKRTRQEMPVYKAGSLVILEHSQNCLGAGFITQEIADEMAPCFEIFVALMLAPARLSRSAAFSESGYRTPSYILAGDADLTGSIRLVRDADRRRICDDISGSVDPRLFDIFWSREERQQIAAEAAERLRIKDAITALMAQLESTDEA